MAVSTIKRTPTVANNLTTTTEGSVLDARQGKALDDKIANLGTWQHHDSTTGTTPLTLPTTYNELQLTLTGSNTQTRFTYHFIKLQLGETVQKFYAGYYNQSNIYGAGMIEITDTTVTVNTLRVNGTDYKASAILDCWYK